MKPLFTTAGAEKTQRLTEKCISEIASGCCKNKMNPIQIETQISAGGVAFRQLESVVEVALISTGDKPRWQLPKGIVSKNEREEDAARREVREEAGIVTELISLIDVIEYWYYGTKRGKRTRFHKYVHFYLLRYQTGDTRDHDHEVREARWVEIEAAQMMLAFNNERRIAARAKEMIEGLKR